MYEKNYFSHLQVVENTKVHDQWCISLSPGPSSGHIHVGSEGKWLWPIPIQEAPAQIRWLHATRTPCRPCSAPENSIEKPKSRGSITQNVQVPPSTSYVQVWIPGTGAHPLGKTMGWHFSEVTRDWRAGAAGSHPGIPSPWSCLQPPSDVGWHRQYKKITDQYPPWTLL